MTDMTKQTEAISTERALKLALEALEAANGDEHRELVFEYREGVITALRKALAEQPAPMIRGDIRDGLVDDEPAQQEPGRNHWEDGDVFERIGAMKKQPAQRTWVHATEWRGLTDEDIASLDLSAVTVKDAISDVRAVEAKLWEKNGITKEQT